MSDTNWHIVNVDHNNTRIMLNLRDTSVPYFNIHYIDLAGDSTYVEFVHDRGIVQAERVGIDRISPYNFGPVGDHEKAIRQEIEKRGLPELDVDVSGLF